MKKSVYLAYMSSWGAYFVLPVLFVSLLHLERVSQVCRPAPPALMFLRNRHALNVLACTRQSQVLQNLWLSVWSNATAADPHINSSNYLMVYFGLGVLSLVFAFTRTIALVYGAFNASRQLHRRLLATILRMPMSFFDTQPTGRLLNRFTKVTIHCNGPRCAMQREHRLKSSR